MSYRKTSHTVYFTCTNCNPTAAVFKSDSKTGIAGAQGFLIAIRLQASHPYAPAFACAFLSLVSLVDLSSNLHQI
jgi:hypothetical protein